MRNLSNIPADEEKKTKKYYIMLVWSVMCRTLCSSCNGHLCHLFSCNAVTDVWEMKTVDSPYR